MKDGSKLSQQWLELFRAGDYGDKGKFTVQDLDRIAASYDPSFHEAPLVIGHPESNKPAYGWIDRLKSDGGVLFGKPKQVDPAFEEGVEAGRFKKRSASFYVMPDGTKYLRHVGFLGAQPPEVKGLADAVFHDQGNQFVEVNFEEDQMSFDEKSFFEKLTAFLKGEKVAAETKNFSEADVQRIATDAAAKAAAEAVKPLQATIEKQQATIMKFEEDAKSAKISTAAKEAIAKLKTAGKWIPAFDKMGVVQVFDELAKSAVTVEFGEGSDKKQVAPLDLLVSFFEGLPKIVPAGQLVSVQAKTEFAEGSRVTTAKTQVDGNSAKLDSMAKARSREKGIPYGDALSQVSNENPSLTRSTSMSAGAV